MTVSDTQPAEKKVVQTNDQTRNTQGHESDGPSLTTVAPNRTDAGVLSKSFDRSGTVQLASASQIEIPSTIAGAPGYAMDRTRTADVRGTAGTDKNIPQASQETLDRFRPHLSNNDAVSKQLQETLGRIDKMSGSDRALMPNVTRSAIATAVKPVRRSIWPVRFIAENRLPLNARS